MAIQYRRLYYEMRRYKFLTKDDIYDALNSLRDAFLAAKNGVEVEEIINGVLTTDERLKIGRRIIIAECIKSGMNFDEIVNTLKVGRSTIMYVARKLDQNPNFINLILARQKKVESEYKKRRYRLAGGAGLVFKRKEYTGFRRKDVDR